MLFKERLRAIHARFAHRLHVEDIDDSFFYFKLLLNTLKIRKRNQTNKEEKMQVTCWAVNNHQCKRKYNENAFED